MNPESLELDFHPVGDGERCGDAISARYTIGNDTFISVIDGGTQDSGATLVEFINENYDNPELISSVVCTHGDDDHTSGLRAVVEAFDIGVIYMNRPWLYASELVNEFDRPYTTEGLARLLKEAYPILVEIDEMATAKGITISEAFQGTQIDSITVLAPSRERYISLIPQFSRTPDAPVPLREGVVVNTQRALDLIPESWEIETLDDFVQEPTSASNESSVVQYGNLDGKRFLLTGDAGEDGLHEAIAYAQQINIQLPGLEIMQVPHHGSRHNVSKSVLNQLLGQPLPTEQENVSAIASVSSGTETHPRKKVTNAFKRRGAPVSKTAGEGILCRGLTTSGRAGWEKPVVKLPLFSEVEK